MVRVGLSEMERRERDAWSDKSISDEDEGREGSSEVLRPLEEGVALSVRRASPSHSYSQSIRLRSPPVQLRPAPRSNTLLMTFHPLSVGNPLEQDNLLGQSSWSSGLFLS